jgi:selenide,water dikinase
MATLNNAASELMQELGVHACTDITGFGLIGHTIQLAQNSSVGVRLSWPSIPLFPEVNGFLKRGLFPGGLLRNREYYSNSVVVGKVPPLIQDILFDPQTSGGLLIAVEEEKAGVLLNKLRKTDTKDAAIIGEVVGKQIGVVVIA